MQFDLSNYVDLRTADLTPLTEPEKYGDDPSICFLRSNIMEFGLGVTDQLSNEAAAEEARLGDAIGDPLCTMKYGFTLLLGSGVKKNPIESQKKVASVIHTVRDMADQGHVYAQLLTSLALTHGISTKQDFEAGFAYMDKAAQAGEPLSQYNQATNYFRGRGVKADKIESIKLFEKAAEQHVALACKWLGNIYLHGEGVPKDPAKALAWYHKGAEEGEIDCQAHLAIWYFDPEDGSPFDYAEAFKWARASMHGNRNAKLTAAILSAKTAVDDPDCTIAEAFRLYSEMLEDSTLSKKYRMTIHQSRMAIKISAAKTDEHGEPRNPESEPWLTFKDGSMAREMKPGLLKAGRPQKMGKHGKPKLSPRGPR